MIDRIIKAFRNHAACEAHGAHCVNLSTDGERIYSYRMAIAGRGLDGKIEVLYARCSPSMTTSKHIGCISHLADRQVDALGCPCCPTCHGYHDVHDKAVCELIMRTHNDRVKVTEAEAHGLTPTMWRNPTELRAAGLMVVMAPRRAPWDGIPAKYLKVDCCWVEPNVARMLEICGGAEGVTRQQVICALRLAASAEDYRIALKVAAEADGRALAGFIQSSTAGVNLSDRHPSARQLAFSEVDDA